MDEWCEVVLGDVLAIRHGFAFEGKHFTQGGSTCLLTPGNFYEGGGFRDRGASQKSYEGPVPSGYELRPDSVVIAMTEQSQGLLGSSGRIPADGKTWLHNQRIGLVCSTDRADDDFIYYLMNASIVRNQISATATGTKVRHTAPGRIEAVKVRLPGPGIQRRIAAVLSAFDELIEINERRIELLEDLARSLYREWFVHFRFPGHEDVEMVDSELGPIPEGWEVRTFAEAADFINGYAFKPAHHGAIGRPIIKIKELKQGVNKNTPRYAGLDLDQRFLVEPGDLLFSWSADLDAYLWSGEPGFLNQHLFAVSPKMGMTRSFLFHALREAMGSFKSRAQGTTMRHIKRSALREVSFAAPGERLRSDFTELVEPTHAQAINLRHLNEQLAATRDLLLPRLVTGRLDISEVDLGVLTPTEVE